MNPLDRRVKRTQKLLMDALLGLSLERGYDAVTIKDITDKADVSYSTFFRHHTDKESLLRAMLGEAVNTMREVIGQSSKRDFAREGRVLFEHVQTQEALFRVIFSSQGANPVLQQVQHDIYQDLFDLYSLRPGATLPLDVAVNHLVISILGLVKWWLDHKQPYSIEQMSRIYEELIIRATEHALWRTE